LCPDGKFQSGALKITLIIQDADTPTSINGMPVSNICGFIIRMAKIEPSETVNMKVLRNGKKEILIIQL
jgi:S1-C subfamily serine protease